MKNYSSQPSPAFIGASWFALIAGFASFIIGLWNNKTLEFNEQGYYFAVIMYGLFSAVSIQKCVRDKMEGISVTPIYYGLSWASTIIALALLVIGLCKSNLDLSEQGFFGMSFLLSMFSAIAVQKNTRDSQSASKSDYEHTSTEN